MPCFSPLKGWRSKSANPNGKRPIVFNRKDAFIDLPVEVPCGQCIGCRLERSRQWAVRCVHEAKLHEQNSFITLTYSQNYLPPDGGLRKEDVQKFFKRFRKLIHPQKLRYFYCGEYGEDLGRPHYHAIIFGYDFPDKKLLRSGEHPIYTSETLSTLWPFGISSIGSVTFESAAYVARYVTKKVTGQAAEDHYKGRQPEFVDMSRRPGVAKEFALKYKDEILNNDSVICRGIEMRPPRFYDNIYDIHGDDEKALLDRNKFQRQKLASKLQKRDPGADRLLVKEKVTKLKLKQQLKRSYEND